MEYRKLGTSDLELTTIGLGTWAIGGGGWEYGWGTQQEADSIATIHRALDLGINWLDTAAAYGLGRSEEVIGKALRGKRDQVLIATKCGLAWDDQGNVHFHSEPASLRQELEASLRRLQTDRIDLYQIHWPDPKVPLADSWGTMADFVQEGKVRYIGVSNYSIKQMQACQAIHPVTSLQPPYSLIRRDAEDALLPFCREQQIGVVAYSPMESGLLTGKFNLDRVAADDWRRQDTLFQEPNLSQHLAFVEALRPIAAATGHTVAHLAVAWTLRDPVITSAIVGARSVAQVEQMMQGAEYRLSDDELAAIAQARQTILG